MPKRLAFVQGGYYHIYNRGAGRQDIFREERNYVYVLRLLKKVAGECNVTVIAYRLLPNHYHWLLHQDGEMPAGRVPARVLAPCLQACLAATPRRSTAPMNALEPCLKAPTKHWQWRPTST